MPSNLRLVIAQLNLLVGDVAGNTRKIIEAAIAARDEHHAQVIVFPELTICGYPPEDLLLRKSFIRAIDQAIEHIATQVAGIDVVLGYPHQTEGGLFNSALLLRDGKRIAEYHKFQLPNYGVFDEKRYFLAGTEPCVVEIGGVPVGLTVCEDVWYPGAVEAAYQAGAKLLLNLNASPFHAEKGLEREAALRQRLVTAPMPIVYVNMVGGQDELVFDGESLVMSATGEVCYRAAALEEGLFPVVLEIAADGTVTPAATEVSPHLPRLESIYKTLVLGVRDYIEKNAFPGAIIGLSGGIDSALTLAITVDAIGPERVEAVMMPSQFTHTMSLEDARFQAQSMGVDYRVLPITPAFETFLDTLAGEFAGTTVDATEENIQARCRGILLMAISNKKHKVVITTGNKSEMSVGYATLYGDMAGGFSALKDVSKSLVYQLADYRNGLSAVIPQRVIERPPSAELAADQKDTDSLPPYDVLDPILEMYVEQDISADDIIAAGYDRDTVRRIVRMVNRNEYKRRQAAPGVRISRRAFGRDRRYPITSGFDR